MEYHSYIFDHCVFVKKFSSNDFIILLFYVDDMVIISQDSSKNDNIKKEPTKSFVIKVLGLAKQILSMKISCDKK